MTTNTTMEDVVMMPTVGGARGAAVGGVCGAVAPLRDAAAQIVRDAAALAAQ